MVLDETISIEKFRKSVIEIGTFNNIEELKDPQNYENGGIFILDDLNEREMNNPIVQIMSKRSHHNILSIFIFTQDCYELTKLSIRASGNIYYIFKPNIFRDVQNLYQDKRSIDMTFNEFKYLTSTCWDKKYQPLTIDMTKDKYTGQFRLGFNSLFVPDTSSS